MINGLLNINTDKREKKNEKGTLDICCGNRF